MLYLTTLISICYMFLLPIRSYGFQYSDFQQWDGSCNDSASPLSPQQSPLNVITSEITGTTKLSIKAEQVSDLLLNQQLKRSKDGHLMILHSDAGQEHSLLKFTYRETEYELDHIHSHWGKSEHEVNGQAGDGSFHLVFTGNDVDGMWTPIGSATAVIEIIVKFVDELSPGVIDHFPRCPDRPNDDFGDLDGGCPLHLSDDAVTIDESQDEHPVHHQSSHISDKTLLESLGWAGHDFGLVVKYVGSLTTPPCTGPVYWFVQTKPVMIHDPLGDWVGCGSFRNAHVRGNKDEICGNYRPLQPKKDFTQFKLVDIDWNLEDHSAEPSFGNC